MGNPAESQDWPGLLPATHYMDNRIYLSEQILENETRNIFGKIWAFCAHESELPEVGDYITTRLAGTPLVLVRGPDRKLRALRNVCPHRGTTVVREPAGSAKGFTCLFHRWTFDTQGRCTSVPQPEGFKDVGLDLDNFSMREYRVEEKLGLIFVTLDDAAEPLEDFLDGVLGVVEDVIGPEPMEVFHYHRIVIPTNWKLWAATNVELYHVWLHSLNRSTSLQVPSWLQRKLRLYRNGHVAFEPVRHAYDKRQLGTRDVTLPGLGPNEARLAHVFPDLLVNIRSSNMRLDRITPLGTDKVMVEFRGLGLKGEPEAIRRRRVRDHNEFWGPFGRNLPEDALAAVTQMQALRSGSIDYSLCAREDGITPATTDAPMRHFNSEWARLMGCTANAPFGDAAGGAAQARPGAQARP